MVMAVEYTYRDVYHLGDYVVEIYREGLYHLGDYTVGDLSGKNSRRTTLPTENPMNTFVGNFHRRKTHPGIPPREMALRR